MKNKIIAVLFILLIYVVGGATVLKSINPAIETIKEHGLNGGTPKRMESTIQREIYKKYYWIDIHGATQRLLYRTVVDGANSPVFKLSDGSITGGCSKKGDKEIQSYADAVVELKESVTAGSEFIYVQLPFKVGDDNQLPPGIHSFANDNADRLLQNLNNSGVETIDVRQLIRDDNLDWASLFYITDHHWRPQTAMWAAGKISNYLALYHGYNYDAALYDEDNFKIEAMKNLFLGSLGRRTGSLYAGVDDFELFLPAYETKFDFTSYLGDEIIHREGSFREALIDDSNLKKDYYNINNYAAYTGDSTKTTTTINYNSINNKKILLIRDSYSCALQPFLSLSQEEITTIDLRYFDDESIIDHIKNNDYDLVIVAYTPTAFDTQRFTFNKIIK